MGSYRGSHSPREQSAFVVLPLLVLSLFSVVGAITLHHWFPKVHIDINPSHGLMGSWTAAVGVGFALFLYTVNRSVLMECKGIPVFVQRVCMRCFYVDELYAIFVVAPLRALASICYSAGESVIIRGLVYGVSESTLALGEVLRFLHYGSLPVYLLQMLCAFVFFVFFFFLL